MSTSLQSATSKSREATTGEGHRSFPKACGCKGRQSQVGSVGALPRSLWGADGICAIPIAVFAAAGQALQDLCAESGGQLQVFQRKLSFFSWRVTLHSPEVFVTWGGAKIPVYKNTHLITPVCSADAVNCGYMIFGGSHPVEGCAFWNRSLAPDSQRERIDLSVMKAQDEVSRHHRKYWGKLLKMWQGAYKCIFSSMYLELCCLELS